MLEELTKRLSKLGIKGDDKKKEEVESEAEEKSDTDHELIQLEQMLKETEPAEVNRIKYPKARATMELKPYYPRPSPINLQFEDTGYNYMQYDGTSIVEWNIDGLSDYQIKNVLQYMTMYATASRAKGNDDPSTAKALIAGFGGQLKGWWDFAVSTEGKEIIFKMVKQEGAQQVPDVVNTLLYTIGLHFIGSVNMLIERAQEQLINLRCPDLSHFKWYKDTFFSLVFIREDSNNSVWKEKFLAGLPALFAERVRDQIRSKHNGNIPYQDYTYGELASEIVTAGVSLCNELKIHKQMKKERFHGKQILGSFCDQYGIQPLKFPSTKFRGGRPYKPYKKNRRLYYKKPWKEKGKTVRVNNPEKGRKRPDQSKAEKTIVCYRCGKRGHYANKCRVKQQIQALTIDEDLKEALAKILLNETDSEQETMEINAVDYTTEEESS
ncbi:hypothetical protein MANES_S095214v8, partial [Manihot esculenta]